MPETPPVLVEFPATGDRAAFSVPLSRDVLLNVRRAVDGQGHHMGWDLAVGDRRLNASSNFGPTISTPGTSSRTIIRTSDSFRCTDTHWTSGSGASTARRQGRSVGTLDSFEGRWTALSTEGTGLLSVSRTATAVALWRARESTRAARTRLFEDPFAYAFLGRRLRWALHLSRLPVIGARLPWSAIDGHWAGSRGTVVVRTRYIDDVLGEALRAGVEQVVILGAGFDSRAYRIPGIEQVRVFEVDHPLTQTKKRAVVVRRLGAIPPHVTFAAIDFRRDTLNTVMTRSGHRPTAPTLFICEGVTHYLTGPAVDAMFEYVADNAPPGSRIVFTYIHRGILDGTLRSVGADTTLATVRQSGEPYTFGFEPSELPRYLGARGLTLIEDVGASTYRERYLVPLGREGEELAEFQRAALAEVSAQEREDLDRHRTG
jgi:methyltransferase (TIGR00027 family)